MVLTIMKFPLQLLNKDTIHVVLSFALARNKHIQELDHVKKHFSMVFFT